jgi:flagellar M-ring protein FliF
MNPLRKTQAWWNESSALPRSLAVVGVLVLVLGLMLVVSATKAEEEMAPLFTQMGQSDASVIVEKLRELKVDYELIEQGSGILVPRTQVHEVRLTLAGEGLPRGGGIGFEIFDQSTLMMSNFTQKVNYLRAMQGELARTIAQFPQVISTRVHLVMPDDSVFSRNKAQPSASVYLRLRRGTRLNKRQLSGITHLVSTSVEGLSAARVAVIDGEGKLLGFEPDTEDGGNGSRELAIQQEFEIRLERRLTKLLETVVGHGGAIARVNVEMDLAKAEVRQEAYDADNAVVRTERKTNENANRRSVDRQGVAGVPGNAVQPPADPNAAAGTNSDSARTTQELDYAIPKTVTHTKRQIGNVKRITVAVLLDANVVSGENTVTGGAAATEDPVQKPKPFDVQGIAEIVKSTVGFNSARGDKVELMVVPFAQPDLPEFEAPQVLQAGTNWLLIAVAGLLGLMLLMMGLIIAKKRKVDRTSKTGTGEQSDDEKTLSIVHGTESVHVPGRPEIKTIHDAVRGIRAQMASGASQSLRDEVRRFAQGKPDSTAALLKQWVATDVTKTVEDTPMNLEVQVSEG